MEPGAVLSGPLRLHGKNFFRKDLFRFFAEAAGNPGRY